MIPFCVTTPVFFRSRLINLRTFRCIEAVDPFDKSKGTLITFPDGKERIYASQSFEELHRELPQMKGTCIVSVTGHQTGTVMLLNLLDAVSISNLSDASISEGSEILFKEQSIFVKESALDILRDIQKNEAP